MFPLMPSIPTTVGPEYCNIKSIAGKQDEDLKITFLNMTKVLKK